MKLSSLFVVLGAVWMGGAALVAQGAAAQEPTNLQVLPKTWTRQQINALMQTFNTSLGVQCAHCHTEDPDAPDPLPGQNRRLDYALDTKPTKEISRVMIKMTMDLNTAARQPGESDTLEKMSCYTCHRGQETPAFTPDGGWGRGNFALHPAGPTVPQRGGGGPRGGGAAPPSSN